MSSRDLYAVLEIPRDADENAIRRAYKKAALKWHPDKNPDNKEVAERNFKRVSQAYEVLSDPQKRRLYDQGGLSAVESGDRSGGGASSQGAGFAFHNPFDIFEQFFGGRDPFAEMAEMHEAMHNMHTGQQSRRTQGQRGNGSNSRRSRGHADGMFNPFGMNGMDPFGTMGGMGMGNMGSFTTMGGPGMMSFSSSSSSMGGNGGTSTSVSQQTQIVNGRRVTKTIRRTTHPDGTVQEEVDEEVADAPQGGQHITTTTRSGGGGHQTMITHGMGANPHNHGINPHHAAFHQMFHF